MKGADETITKTDASTISHGYTFAYDMRSQLTDANISNINGGNWVAKYFFNDNGDMAYRTIQSDSQSFFYNGHLMTNADGNTLDYDENGNMTSGVDDISLAWNWDNKLRSAAAGPESISLKYDPLGNRIFKASTANGNRKYIVDIVGDLPVILMEIDATDYTVKKAYIYGNSQIIAQYDGDWRTPLDCKNFYLHDRLGSVRQIINCEADVVKMYTYEPFGQTIEEDGTFDNPFCFSGQFFDDEIDEYYLRARQYDPYISRFTNRDAADGKFDNPLSLHKYLYCQNDPVDRIDPWGLLYLIPGAGPSYNLEETQQVITAANQMVGTDIIKGPLKAFGRLGEFGVGEFDYKMYNEIYGGRLDFRIGNGERLLDSEFGNYLAGYTLFYNYRAPGIFGSWVAGHYYGLAEWYQYRTGVSERYIRWAADDFGSQYWQAKGCLDANRVAYKGLGAQLDNIIIGAAVWNLNILRYLDYFQYSEGAL